MSATGRMPESVSSSDDTSITVGCLTPTSEQTDGQSTSNLVPLAGKLTFFQVSTSTPPNGESPDKELARNEGSASIGVERNGDHETDLAPQQQEIIYDDEGDIVLIIGLSQSHKFRLSSKLLASTSSKWEDLITSAKEAGSGTVHLPDSDPKSMTILLQIIHLRFSALPRSITFQELYSVASLSNKYQVRELLRPFVLKWTEPFIREELDPEQTEWILISYEFYIGYILEQWVEHLARSTKKDENGYLVYRDHKLADLLPDCLRDGLTEKIKDERLLLLSNLVEVCKKGLEETFCVWSGECRYEEQCNMLMAGYLLMGLGNLGGWPLDPSTIRTSAEEFKANLIVLDSKTLPGEHPGDDEFYTEEHDACGFHRLKHEIAAVRLSGLVGTGLKLWDGQKYDTAVPISPFLCRLGFCSRDFEDVESGNETDESYDEGSNSESEPDEEFQVDESENEGYEDGEDNYGEGGIVG